MQTFCVGRIQGILPNGAWGIIRDTTKEQAVAYSVVSKKSGKTYYLHTKDVTLRGGRQQTIYFFAQDVREGVMEALPDGYIVSENPRTGLPLLKKG
jgi:hypothetical protein